MCRYLAFLVAILLSLNAAAASVVGICDALEHTQSKVAHFGHHSHDHDDDHDHDVSPANSGEPGSSSVAGDHHHAHVHPGFSVLLPGLAGVMPLDGQSLRIPGAIARFASAPRVRLDRPPRTALA